MKRVNVLLNRFNLSELYERLFYGGFEWCVYEELKASRIRVFLKQTPRHRRVNKLRIQEWLERELRCINCFSHPYYALIVSQDQQTLTHINKLPHGPMPSDTAALSSFFSSWSSPALRLGLPSVLVTPFPIRVSSEMSLLHLKDNKTSKKLKWKINITKLISNTFNTCKYI